MDKMREEFEAWAASIGFTLKPNAWSNGDYAMGYGWQEWNAWKASRAALCVELNSVVFSRDKNGDGGLMLPERVFKAMDDAGASYK